MAEKQLSAKKAPRRHILETVRVGDWGEVEYRHRLSCGHTVVRKRISKSAVVACVDCLKAAAFSRGDLSPRVPVDEDVVFQVEVVNVEIQSALASILGVSPEAVDIVMDAYGGIRYALIFIPGDDVARLTSG